MVHPFRYAAILGLISLLCIAQSSINQPAPYEAGPNPDGLNLAEAIALYKRGDFAKAIAKYKELLQARPTSPDAWAGLIRSYLKSKDVSTAAKSAEQGLD